MHSSASNKSRGTLFHTAQECPQRNQRPRASISATSCSVAGACSCNHSKNPLVRERSSVIRPRGNMTQPALWRLSTPSFSTQGSAPPALAALARRKAKVFFQGRHTKSTATRTMPHQLLCSRYSDLSRHDRLKTYSQLNLYHLCIYLSQSLFEFLPVISAMVCNRGRSSTTLDYLMSGKCGPSQTNNHRLPFTRFSFSNTPCSMVSAASVSSNR